MKLIAVPSSASSIWCLGAETPKLTRTIQKAAVAAEATLPLTPTPLATTKAVATAWRVEMRWTTVMRWAAVLAVASRGRLSSLSRVWQRSD